MTSSDRPVSPVNGQPVPNGRPPYQPGDEAREIGRRGGLKSAQVRAERKTLREELINLLDAELTDKNTGKKMGTREALSSALIKQALGGNTKAYEIIRDTIGEKPIENVTIKARGFDALDAAFEGIKDDDE